MDLPEDVLERFREAGRSGGQRRAALLPPDRRTTIARQAAAVRWLRRRFGAASFEELGLPGWEIVDPGLADLAAERVTNESLAISIAAPRLRREGVPVSPELEEPERRLYRSLAATEGGLAHARYNAILRRLVSFADACRLARIDEDRRSAR